MARTLAQQIITFDANAESNGKSITFTGITQGEEVIAVCTPSSASGGAATTSRNSITAGSGAVLAVFF